MGKGRGLTLRVRFKDDKGVKSKLVFTNGKKKKMKSKGQKFLRVQKVSKEELYHVGEFNDLPERLMKEFIQSKKNGHQPVNELEKVLSEVV